MTQSIRQWLEHLGLTQYADAFLSNHIDVELLPQITDQVLKDIGVASAGHRLRILQSVATLPAHAVAQVPTDTSPERRARPTADAERRQLTIMFCDLVGSTALAQELDPEQLRELMQSYQQTCGNVIEKYDGHVAQYLGDGLMTYFGWPKAHENDAERAVRSGIAIIAAIKSVCAEKTLAVRIGIATGPVVVGATGGGDASIPKLAVGETPNLAARLQGLAQADQIVIAPSTHRLLASAFEYQDLGAQNLKGIVEQVHAWRVIGERRVQGRFEASRGKAGLTALVGRDEELALLLRRWESAKGGEGQAVHLSGEPGIGKSRIIRSVAEHLKNAPHYALLYQCSPFHTQSAMFPVIEQIEQASGLGREDSAEGRLNKLEAWLAEVHGPERLPIVGPLMASLMGLPIDRHPSLNLSPQKLRERTIDAVVEHIARLSKRQPLLLTVEDAHWIDATTQEVLDLLTSRIASLPALLLVTYRPEYQPRWSGEPQVTILTLSRLSRRLGAQLVSEVCAGKTLPQELLDQIAAKTDGVPLFVEELTKAVLESGLVRDQGVRYELVRALSSVPIPATLRDSLMARLDRFASTKEIAQIGACIGREFSYELLRIVSGQRDPDLDDALITLVNAELVLRRGQNPDATYTFKHALIQDAAYESLLHSRRAQIHSQIARAIETHFPERTELEPEALARHFTQAGLLEAALPYWLKAGALARKRFAMRDAISHLERGLELCKQMSKSSARDLLELELRIGLAFAWIAINGWTGEKLSFYLEPAWPLAEELCNPELTAATLWGLWVNRQTSGAVRDSGRWANLALREGARLKDDLLKLVGEFCLASNCHYLGDHQSVIQHTDTLQRICHTVPRHHLKDQTNHDALSVRVVRAHSEWMLGFPDRAVDTAERTLNEARSVETHFGLGWVLFTFEWLFGLRRETGRMSELLKEYEQLGEQQGILFLSYVIGPIHRAWIQLEANEYVDAWQQFEATRHRWSGVSAPLFLSLQARAGLEAGELAASTALVCQALEQIERPGWEERAYLPEVLRVQGLIRSAKGDTTGSEHSFQASLAWARKHHARSWELRTATSYARLLRDHSRREDAIGVLHPVYDWFTEGFDTKDLQEARALLEELRG